MLAYCTGTRRVLDFEARATFPAACAGDYFLSRLERADAEYLRAWISTITRRGNIVIVSALSATITR